MSYGVGTIEIEDVQFMLADTPECLHGIRGNLSVDSTVAYTYEVEVCDAPDGLLHKVNVSHPFMVKFELHMESGRKLCMWHAEEYRVVHPVVVEAVRAAVLGRFDSKCRTIEENIVRKFRGDLNYR